MLPIFCAYTSEARFVGMDGGNSSGRSVMPTPRDPIARKLLISFAGTAACAMLIAAITLPVWVKQKGAKNPQANAESAAFIAASFMEREAGGKHFTLRLGQGFRFKDGVVVVPTPDEQPDIVFKYLAPQGAGQALRYNEQSQQVEVGLGPALTSPVPVLLSAHISAFDTKPDIARITSGDIADYFNQAPVFRKTRYLLLMNQNGDQYLLTLDELQDAPGKFDDWRVGFSYEPVKLPVGLKGGKINKPLPGKIIYRDWYRTRMIMRVDLISGKEEPIADGILPSTVGDRLLGYGDSTSAYVVRDASGKILHTIRFNEQFLGPLLSPDGTRLLGTVKRPGAESRIGGLTFPGVATLSVGVFDLTGKEIVSIVGYDDATWTPDGKIIATGKLYDAGLFEIDPTTKSVRPIAPEMASPFQPDVSPDGKTIAFITGNKVWLIDRDGKNLRQLFQDGRNQQRPAFSPDGTKVAFIICNQLGVDASGEVFVFDLKANDITPLRTSTGALLVPDTSTKLNWIP